MDLVYKIDDKPPFRSLVVLAFQQLLAIIAATIAVPAIVGNGLTASAALFGAGAGTMVYLLFTRFRSPVFLGSSFAFIGSMFAAFAGGVSMTLGFAGLIIGALIAGLVYLVLAIVVKISGTGWIDRMMPAVVIGPTVAIIGLSLAGNAVSDSLRGDTSGANQYIALICALFTLFAIINSSVYGKRTRLTPFIVGIAYGYVLALILTLVGRSNGNASLLIMDFETFKGFAPEGGFRLFSVPDFVFAKGLRGFKELTPVYLGTIFVAYAPVAFVTFAEHLSDHINLSTIIGKDLTKDPGLHNTLMGDGVGSFVGAFFGGCTNTTYGESVACVAITGNASVRTILCTAFMAIIISFINPIIVVLDSIPACVMGGTCITLYGFIAVSGLKMIKNVDLNDNGNLFTVSTILIAGIGGMTLKFGRITLTEVASALILGILVNAFAHLGKRKGEKQN